MPRGATVVRRRAGRSAPRRRRGTSARPRGRGTSRRSRGGAAAGRPRRRQEIVDHPDRRLAGEQDAGRERVVVRHGSSGQSVVVSGSARTISSAIAASGAATRKTVWTASMTSARPPGRCRRARRTPRRARPRRPRRRAPRKKLVVAIATPEPAAVDAVLHGDDQHLADHAEAEPEHGQADPDRGAATGRPATIASSDERDGHQRRARATGKRL